MVLRPRSKPTQRRAPSPLLGCAERGPPPRARRRGRREQFCGHGGSNDQELPCAHGNSHVLAGGWCHHDGVLSLWRGLRTQGAPLAWRRPAAAAPPRPCNPPTPAAAGGRARGGASARRNDSTSGGADPWRLLGVVKSCPDEAPGQALRGSPAGRRRHWGTLTGREFVGDEVREAGAGG